MDWLYARYRKLFADWDAEIVVADNDENPFNRSAARNYAFYGSTGDILLIADADTLFHRDQIETAIQMIERGANWVIPYNTYYNMSEAATDNILALDPTETVVEPTSAAMWEHKIQSWAGLLVMPREAFAEAGGYDVRFSGWGYEDNAFRYAVDTMWGPHDRVTWGYALHLWHPVTAQNSFTSPSIETNRALYRDYESAAYSRDAMRRVLGFR